MGCTAVLNVSGQSGWTHLFPQSHCGLEVASCLSEAAEVSPLDGSRAQVTSQLLRCTKCHAYPLRTCEQREDRQLICFKCDPTVAECKAIWNCHPQQCPRKDSKQEEGTETPVIQESTKCKEVRGRRGVSWKERRRCLWEGG